MQLKLIILSSTDCYSVMIMFQNSKVKQLIVLDVYEFHHKANWILPRKHVTSKQMPSK